MLLHVGTGTHDPVTHPTQTNCTAGYTPPSVTSPHTFPGQRADGASAQHNLGSAATAPYVVPVLSNFTAGARWSNATLICGADKAGSSKCAISNPSGTVCVCINVCSWMQHDVPAVCF